ncbi:unnamed protein product [Calicophoron daubneyi]|uniref:Thioredoxin n=1 Tax=Calicophoron daubneyi TaxID=300641 RepID=A0AAV2T7L7_CALDB
MVSHVNKKDEVIKFVSDAQGKLVVLDFYAEWCGPCKRIAPVVEQLSTQYPDVKFAKIDVDQDSECSAHYKVNCMPTFVFFKNGTEVERFSGADETKLRSAITKYK